MSTVGNIPKCFDGTFFTLLNSDEIKNNVKTKCVLCEEEKKETKIISGAIKSTSNFRLHIKVSVYYLINITRMYNLKYYVKIIKIRL